MASKYSVELSLDTKGYKEGAKQAEDANADFASSIGEVSKSLPNLRKALAAARKETTGLAFAYSKLSEQEKNSGFGKAMAKQLNEAKKRTAELIDMNGDLANELKNLASDTAAWDAMKEGIGIVKDSMTAAITTFGEMTNTADDLAPVLKKVAQVQSIAATAISVGNALQKQSAVMCGIRKIQEVALTKAIEAETVAQGKATVAQKLFNAVAKANPYVLLASAVLAAGAALATYITLTHKSAEAIEEEKKALDRRQTAANSMAESLEDTIPLYTRLQTEWNKLSSDMERAKWIQEKKDDFHKLGVEINNIGDAENFLVTNTEAVKQAFMQRALAAAAAAEAAEVYKQEMEAVNKAASGQKVSMKEALGMGLDRADVAKNAKYNHGWFGNDTYELNEEQITKARQNAIKKAQERIGKLYEDMSEHEKKAADKMADAGVKAYIDAEKKKQKAIKNGSAETIKYAIGSLADLEAQLSKLQNDRKNGLNPKLDTKEYLRQVDDLTKRIKNKKIELGFEKPDTKLQELQKQLDDAEKAYIIAVDADDEQARQAAQEAYYKAQAELDKYTASIKIEPKTSDADRANIQSEVNDIVSEALNGKQHAPSFDFSALKDKLPEELAGVVDTTLEEYNRIYEARQQLMDKMNKKGASDTVIAAAKDGLDALHDKWTQLCEDVETYNQANEEVKKANKNAETLANTVEGVGNAVNAAAGLFSALGEASEDNSMKAMGIVAQAIATIALSFAKALTTAKTWVDWLAFGITGMTTMVTMVSQIKKLNAGAFAGGGIAGYGIVGGSSYYGDHMTASVNSGEMILNRRQQKNLFDAIDNNRIGNIGRQSEVSISSVGVEGSDLILTINNTLKENGKKTIG